MSEREPQPSPDHGAGESLAWEPDRLAAALGRPPEPSTDVAFGPGLRFRLGEIRPVELELFPAQGVVRLTGGDLQLSLFRQHAGPRITPEGLIFQLPSKPDGRFLSVSSGGEVALFLTPPSAAEWPQEAPPSPIQPTSAPVLSEPSRTHPRSSAAILDQPIQPGLPETEPQERVRFGGRLGSNPRFRETRTGKLVASFPVAVAEDDGATRWESVVAFDERARKLHGDAGPRKADYVDVIGYRHERQEKGKDGRTRTIREVYAVVVKPR